jgi:hypothetical protein
MQFLHDPDTTISPERPAISSRWLGRSFVAGVLVAASLAVSACGSSGSPTILNTEKVERAIEHSSLAQRGKHAQVSCPSGVQQKKGMAFACTAIVKRASTRFVVTQLDGSGHVHYEAR